MATTPHDDDREQRISNQIIVDTDTGEEERMGWYCYLEDKLNVPFGAVWDGANVEVVAMSSEEECEQEMRVDVRYSEGQNQDVFSVSLSEIDPVDTDEDTTEAISKRAAGAVRRLEILGGEGLRLQ